MSDIHLLRDKISDIYFQKIADTNAAAAAPTAAAEPIFISCVLSLRLSFSFRFSGGFEAFFISLSALFLSLLSLTEKHSGRTKNMTFSKYEFSG